MTNAAHREPRRHARLWRYLWLWAMGAMGLVWVSLVAVAYTTGTHEAGEITDGQLASTAAFLLAWPSAPAQLKAERPASPPVQNAPASFDAYAIELRAVLWEGGVLVSDRFGVAPLLAAFSQPGYYTVQADGSQQWRVFLADNASGTRRVAVLLDIGHRQNLGRDLAEHIVRPALIVLPLVALLLAWAIRRGIRPLEQLSTDIQALNTTEGTTLPGKTRFEELDSIVEAINSLVHQLHAQVDRERRFASDVAHELRTPLAALVWQARLARSTSAPGEREAALLQAESDALRAGRILAQLVDLARAQQAPGHSALLDLSTLAARVLSDHAQQACESRHELILKAPQNPGISAPGHTVMLELMLRNLVENALRHTPAGSVVQMECGHANGSAWLSVSDDGPGATASDPPSQGLGLGLGLTIVQRMAHWQGLEFRREAGEPPFTTRFVFHWPAMNRSG